MAKGCLSPFGLDCGGSQRETETASYRSWPFCQYLGHRVLVPSLCTLVKWSRFASAEAQCSGVGCGSASDGVPADFCSPPPFPACFSFVRGCCGSRNHCQDKGYQRQDNNRCHLHSSFCDRSTLLHSMSCTAVISSNCTTAMSQHIPSGWRCGINQRPC